MLAEITPPTTWKEQFAFWASLVLTLITIAGIAVKGFRRPKISMRLSPDAFFRLGEFGEALFCNSVLLAWNGPVIIIGARATLEKTDEPMKSFPFKVLQVGEKVKGLGSLPEHYFHSGSAISHLAESFPQRVLYFCVQESYEDRSRRAVNAFTNEVLNYKQEILTQAPNTSQDELLSLRQDLLRKVNQIVDSNLSKLMELVQLEPGQYKLSLKVDYQNPKSRIFQKTSTVCSSITFSIGSDVKDILRDNLRQFLLIVATNLLQDTQTPLPYPEYYPLNVK
jgi:hypothetical protein